MKKICSFILVIFSIMSCLIFSACGNMYSNLSMSFYSGAGEEISSLVLTLDDEASSFSFTTVSVEFNGIDNDLVGDATLKSLPEGFVTIENVNLIGNKLSATITAERVNTGKLVVTHLSSGKTKSIDLVVQHKSNSLNLVYDKFLMDIPNEETEIVFNPTEMVELIPSASTDKIYFTLRDGAATLPEGVDVVTKKVENPIVKNGAEETYISAFKVSSEVQAGATVEVVPVTYMKGYDSVKYTSKPITITFIQALEKLENDKGNFAISTDDKHKDYLKNTIVLVAGDTSEAPVATNKYNFNNVHLTLNYVEEVEDGENIVLKYEDLSVYNNSYYYDYYDIECYSENESIYAVPTDNKVVIQANSYTDKEVEVQIKLVPKYPSSFGEIVETVKVVGVVKPNNFEVYMQGEKMDHSKSINLFDYYEMGSNALGALFNFNPIAEHAYVDFRTMQIKVDPRILNAYIKLPESERFSGTNPIYTDKTLQTATTQNEYDIDGVGTVNVASNKYLLEFYYGTMKMKFYFDGKCFVSQTITNTDDIYIKYVETSNEDNSLELDMTLCTFYNGSLKYLEGVKGIENNIKFNRLDGISSINVNAGELFSDGGIEKIEYFKDESNTLVSVANLYLDRSRGLTASSSVINVLNIQNNGVVGMLGKEVGSANFTVRVSGGEDNPLKIKQYQTNDVSDIESLIDEGVTTLSYRFNSEASISGNAICLIYDSTTDVGSYTITFNYANGFSYTINCLVYQTLTVDDIEFSIKTSDKLFNNVLENGNYEFNRYTADYIVARGEQTELKTILNSSFTNEYIQSYEFSESTSFIAVESLANEAKLYFNVADKDNSIEFKIIVKVNKYSNIVTFEDVEDVEKCIYFYIYEPIKSSSDFTISENSTVYAYNKLGDYNKNLSELTVKLEAYDSYLWDYIQSDVQDSAKHRLGLPDSYIKLEMGAVLDANETYYTFNGEEYIETAVDDGNFAQLVESGLYRISSKFKTVWYTQSSSAVTLNQTDNAIQLRFLNRGNIDIYARIKQFHTEYTYVCRITVKEPILTEQVIIDSELDSFNGLPHLNLKAGEPYQFEYRNISSIGEVSNPGLMLFVVDQYGNINTSNVIVDNIKLTITARDNISGSSNLRIIAVAKDVLEINLDSYSAIDDIKECIINPGGDKSNAYNNAYVEIQLILSDGTYSNPYRIYNTDDFWEINQSDALKTKHYLLMSNLDLSRSTEVIDNFNGSIKTNDDSVYKIFVGELNITRKSLFTNFNGELNNIQFYASYKYEANRFVGAGSSIYLGIIDKNSGTLKNVSAEVYGTANLNSDRADALNIYFGGLVGYNNGTIIYDRSCIGVSTSDGSNISLSELDAFKNKNKVALVFGGLVGKNQGTIKGYNSATASNGINFVVYVANEGAMASVVIDSTLTNENSAIGGLVGENEVVEIAESGEIQNAYVTGKITATNNNIGGLVGRNIGKEEKVNVSVSAGDGNLSSVTLTKNQFTNITSNMQLTGNNYVGGIVGHDTNGKFDHCKYQILAKTTTTSILGNNYVGGIAGYTLNGWFKYCSVMSYRWDYADLANTFNGAEDILGNNNVGGIAGGAKSGHTENDISSGEYLIATVTNSSVNAYIKANNSGNVGGLFGMNADRSRLALNVYVMGKLEGETSSDNLGFNIFANNYYTSLQGKTYSPPTGDVNNSIIWQQDDAVNGGNTYIIDKDGKPIFDIAPSSISLSGIAGYFVTVNGTEYKKLIKLEYYEFNLSSNNPNYVTIYKELIDEYNTKEILSVLNIEYAPGAPIISSIHVSASSSNSSIIEINNNKMIVKGTGVVTLRIESVLNPRIYDEVTIHVVRPLGDVYELTESLTNAVDINNLHQGIAKGDSKQYHILSNGKKPINIDGETYEYSYVVSDEIYQKVEVEYNGTFAEGDEIKNYILVSGLSAETVDNVMTVYLNPSLPFSIRVLESISGTFTVTVTPYTVINYVDTELRIMDTTRIKVFTVATFTGATDISLDVNSAVLYPNDNATITVYVTTDLATSVVGTTTAGSLECINTSAVENGIQTFIYKLTTPDDVEEKQTIEVMFEVNGHTAYAEYVLLPQRINDININNYIKEEGEFVLSNTLRPNGTGLMILNVAPNNGFYDYLEISDITGMEEIAFEQISNTNGGLIDTQQSSNRKGIRLTKQDVYYIRTKISSDYSSRMHQVRVSAYLEDGTELYSKIVDIDVKMLPKIDIQYITPNEVIMEEDKLNLANGVEAKLLIETKNSDGDVIISSCSLKDKENTPLNFSEYYTLNNVGGGFWQLICKKYNTELVGATLTIDVETTLTLKNGNFEKGYDSIEFKIVPFVIHNVSVTHSNSGYIAGNIGKELNLEFYFKETDISIYNNGEYWVNEYRYNPTVEHENPISSYEYINTILYKLNYESGFAKINPTDDKITLDVDEFGTRLSVEEGYNTNSKLEVAFKLVKEEDSLNFDIETDETNVFASYKLKFSKIASLLEPKIITNQTEFEEMTSDNKVYALGCDIVLTDYVPIDVNLQMFDGNGHTITIESFGSFDSAEISAGLFSKIYKNMVVCNVEVKYNLGEYESQLNTFSVSRYVDLCNNKQVDYSSASFGGITALNEGIITNCKVSGVAALTASRVETKVANNTIQFNIGGLVANNSSTGRITHSASELKIISKANIAGFVHTNSGKIASSWFDASEDAKDQDSGKGLIYAYNSNVLTSYSISVAGFVVSNTGEISMSYVESGETSNSSGTTVGNISAKDYSAGFAYDNSGLIEDAYTIVDKVGGNSNQQFSGFVTNNVGNVKTSYSYINNGETSPLINMFAPQQTTGIVDCYEIVIWKTGYNSYIESLTTIDRNLNDLSDASIYNKFTFGKDGQGIWEIKNHLPKLTSTKGIIQYSGSNDPNKEAEAYYGLRTIERKERVSMVGGIIVDRTYYYTFNNAGYGDKENPIIIYDLSSWNEYLNETYNNKYFRLVNDIDLNNEVNPKVKSLIFKGNIQGNNMDISGINLYSPETLDSIGLFKELLGGEDIYVDNTISNLDINIASIYATKTGAVGGLAGIITNYNIYGIDIVSEKVLVGGNAVGGLAGIIRGDFSLGKINSTVSANSTRQAGENRYAIYLSKNNNYNVSNNLLNVYYAGSIAGILDGYNYYSYNINSDRLLTNTFFKVENVNVSGSVIMVGDTVGAMFGLVGERVLITNASVKLVNSKLSGEQYSALIAGENRGVITNVIAECVSENTFKNSLNVSAGVVGLNLGGYINNAKVNITINNTNIVTVGGIVGVNINGSVSNSNVNGKLMGNFVGGIVGADYSHNVVNTNDWVNTAFYKRLREGGSGSLNFTMEQFISVVPEKLTYVTNAYTNVSITKSTLDYWYENSSYFYSYKSNSNAQGFDYTKTLDELINRKNVLGLLVGQYVNKPELICYGCNVENISQADFNFVINGSAHITDVGTLNNLQLSKNCAINLENVNFVSNYHSNFITYVCGAEVESFNGWLRNDYGDEILVFIKEGLAINKVAFGNNKFYIRKEVVDGNTTYIVRCYSEVTEDEKLVIDFSFLKNKFAITNNVVDYNVTNDEIDVYDATFSSDWKCTVPESGNINDNTEIQIVLKGANAEDDTQLLAIEYKFKVELN